MLSIARRISTSARTLGLVAALALLPAATYAQNASLRVVHGIPGGDVSPDLDPDLPVDVLVNDAVCLLSGFTFGEVAGPFTIPEGTYNVKVSLANTLEPCGADAVIDADVPIEAANISIVAHLDAEGAPTASLFSNDVSATGQGMARLIAHHVAAAPTVDLLVPSGIPGGSPALLVPSVSNLPGANQAAAEIPATSSLISILPPGGNEALFFRGVSLKPGVTYTAYAVGSLTNGTFTVIVDQIGGLKGFAVRY